jgi:hypothetical protein
MFRHHRVILREVVINSLPSYISISNAGVGNTLKIKMFHLDFIRSHIIKVTSKQAYVALRGPGG